MKGCAIQDRAVPRPFPFLSPFVDAIQACPKTIHLALVKCGHFKFRNFTDKLGLISRKMDVVRRKCNIFGLFPVQNSHFPVIFLTTAVA